LLILKPFLNDPKDLKLAAHTLKGSARYFGKSSLSLLSGELETLATQRQLDDAPRCLAEIREVYARMLPQFHEYRDKN
jgi:HPt (histidine-containing phosphotransfer) domain-containing protein